MVSWAWSLITNCFQKLKLFLLRWSNSYCLLVNFLSYIETISFILQTFISLLLINLLGWLSQSKKTLSFSCLSCRLHVLALISIGIVETSRRITDIGIWAKWTLQRILVSVYLRWIFVKEPRWFIKRLVNKSIFHWLIGAWTWDFYTPLI